MTKAVILCAGKGTRLLPITKEIPKPMITVAKKPLLEYNILLCKKNNIREICINTSYLSEKITGFFGTGSRLGVNITYSLEKELLGTAGALKNFKEELKNDDFFVIYGDNLSNINLKEMMECHKKNKAIATLFLYQEEIKDKGSTVGSVIINKDGKVKEIIEKPSIEEKEKIKKTVESRKYINAGIYALSPKIFKYINKEPIDFASEVFPSALESNEKISGFTQDCFFRELGAKERYKLTEEEISSGKIDSKIFQ